MRIITNHEDAYCQMSCEVCLIETRISSFSPQYEIMVAFFSTVHASCDSTGLPEYERGISEYLVHREKHPSSAPLNGLLFPWGKPRESEPRMPARLDLVR